MWASALDALAEAERLLLVQGRSFPAYVRGGAVMACPRCNGRMFHESELGSDKVIPTCLMCGYEDDQRPTFDLDKV